MNMLVSYCYSTISNRYKQDEVEKLHGKIIIRPLPMIRNLSKIEDPKMVFIDRFCRNVACFVGSVAERVKAQFLRRTCGYGDHDSMI